MCAVLILSFIKQNYLRSLNFLTPWLNVQVWITIATYQTPTHAGCAVSASQVWTHSILTLTLWGRCSDNTHLTVGETEKSTNIAQVTLLTRRVQISTGFCLTTESVFLVTQDSTSPQACHRASSLQDGSLSFSAQILLISCSYPANGTSSHPSFKLKSLAHSWHLLPTQLGGLSILLMFLLSGSQIFQILLRFFLRLF